VLKHARAFPRFARALPAFLRTTVTPEEARRRVEHQLRHRERSFLELLAKGVYANRRSPYAPLLEAAGAQLGDVTALVERDGLESALGQLREAGVYVTLDEFKGRRPIERAGVSFPAGHAHFDNPLLSGHFRSASGGSRGVRRRMSVDLDLLDHEAAYHSMFRTAFDLWDRPFALWRAIPPSASGINNSLRQVKVGGDVGRWFNPYRPAVGREALMFGLFTAYAVRAGRTCGAGLRAPEHCPPTQAGRVARWLADRKRDGRPAVLDTQAGLGVRACLAAAEQGLDIAGTFMRFGGEPYTEAKAEVVAQAGARAVCHYTMAETGRIAVACGTPGANDDMHFLTDKLSILQRDKVVGAGVSVGALSYTTLLPSSSKLMINVESDDYAVLEERECGCPFGELGMSLHMRDIRSYEKLTSEGNHFLGADLFLLVDEVLPARFGGRPGDYQLAEEEFGGLTAVSVVVRPTVGPVADDEVIDTVLAFLRATPRNRLMAEIWASSGTLRVDRREPHLTPSAKILPLHILGIANRDARHVAAAG
jgi:hypothetical protein